MHEPHSRERDRALRGRCLCFSNFKVWLLFRLQARALSEPIFAVDGALRIDGAVLSRATKSAAVALRSRRSDSSRFSSPTGRTVNSSIAADGRDRRSGVEARLVEKRHALTLELLEWC